MWHFRCSSRHSFFKSQKANFSKEYGNTKETSFKMNIVAVVTIFSIIPAFPHYTFEMVREPLKWNELKIFKVACSSCQQHCNCRNFTLLYSKWHTCSSFFSPHPTNQILCIWPLPSSIMWLHVAPGAFLQRRAQRVPGAGAWPREGRMVGALFVVVIPTTMIIKLLKIKRKWNSKNNYNWRMERELDHQHENWWG